MRIYELAKKYGISSEDLVGALKSSGFKVKSHMSSATDEMIEAARRRFSKKKAAEKKSSNSKSAKKKSSRGAAEKAPKKTRTVLKATSASAKSSSPKDVKSSKKKPVNKMKPAGIKKESASKQTRTRTPVKSSRAPAHGQSKRSGAAKPRASTVELQQKAVRESVRRTLAKLEATRKTRRRKEKPKEKEPEYIKSVRVTEQAPVKELAAAFEVDSTEIIDKCVELGSPVVNNQLIEKEIIELLAEEFGKTVEFESSYGDALLEKEETVDPSKLKSRPPVVTVMGHVDHGKTSILDYIRKTNIAGGEAGGITQHIGAYQVSASGGVITFIDTPGHEAFTSMRARGAGITDIVVLVVAADDGVMPQTVEAINHSLAAGVPIIVAINKIDLPGVSTDTIKKQLSERNVLVEEFGGDVLCQEVSAKTGKGIDKLLETINLQAELLELKAMEEGSAKGVIIEVKKDEGRGVLCTLLVKGGTLHIGDTFIAGMHYGKVKALLDYKGKPGNSIKPSTPVMVLGSNGVPNAGEDFIAVDNEHQAREISLKRREIQRERSMRSAKRMTLEELYSQIQNGDVKELLLILKGDTDGSIGALKESLLNLSNDAVKVRIIHSGVGAITESDVLLAASSNALIIGFNVKASPKSEGLAQKEHVEIRNYNIIYECLSEMKDAMTGMLEPELVEKVLGRAEVRKIFKISRLGKIAGSMVIEGSITRNSQARVIREDETLHTGKVNSLKRFQDDVKDVQKDFECGIGVAGFNDLQEGDIIETYIIEQKSKIML